jgi:UDP-4-amino-4,6-dideoxy-N-acetyl-beta-L-altrosamine transaminase
LVKVIPCAKHDLSEEDVDAVVHALRGDFITQGQAVPTFERELSRYVGAEHGVAVNSGTAALHVACLALNLGPGDWLWTTPISFVASANCGIYCGASVDFVDIDSDTGLMSIPHLAEKLRIAADSGRLPKVVIPVHYAGQCCDMKRIHELATKYEFSVIEDTCHALGGYFQGNPAGSCRFSDIATFSFHPAKSITTAEGGMAVTNNDSLAARMRMARSHGISRDYADLPEDMREPWYYQQFAAGFNYRMPDVLAALGISQLKRLDSFIKRRSEIADLYGQLIQDLPLNPLSISSTEQLGHHLYVVRVSVKMGKNFRDDVLRNLRRLDIGANLHYIPIHTQPFYRERGFRPDDFPKAVEFSHQVLSLPMHTSLSNEEVNLVVKALRESIRLASAEHI